jgi:signal transduction histidine kinase
VQDPITPIRRLAERAPPLAIDAAIAAICYAATVVPLAKSDAYTDWRIQALSILGTVPLVWRRRYPIPITMIVGIGTIGLSVLGFMHDLPYGQLVATYTFASLSGPWGRLVGAIGTAIGLTISLLVPGEKLWAIGTVGVSFAAAYTLGTGTRARRDRIAMLEERGRRLTEEQEAAGARERERIARDMHDILAHSISLIVVQAEAGPVVVRTEPAKAEAAFAAIAATGREALTQLRRSLGVLRSNGPDRAPQPDLDAVPALIAQARRAGLDATFTEEGRRRAVEPEVAIAAYRVVQESLTNTLKHARAQSVRVRLEWRDSALWLDVTDDGRGPTGQNGGHGLIGMRERVTACGGELHTGAGEAGQGFRVLASLPAGAERA